MACNFFLSRYDSRYVCVTYTYLAMKKSVTCALACYLAVKKQKNAQSKGAEIIHLVDTRTGHQAIHLLLRAYTLHPSAALVSARELDI